MGFHPEGDMVMLESVLLVLTEAAGGVWRLRKLHRDASR